MTKQEMMDQVANMFKEQMGLDLSEILSLYNDRFVISRDNKLGLSMASLRLDMTDDERGVMVEFLNAVTKDSPIMRL